MVNKVVHLYAIQRAVGASQGREMSCARSSRDTVAPAHVKTKSSSQLFRLASIRLRVQPLRNHSTVLFYVRGAADRNANGWPCSGLQLAKDDKYIHQERMRWNGETVAEDENIFTSSPVVCRHLCRLVDHPYSINYGCGSSVAR